MLYQYPHDDYGRPRGEGAGHLWPRVAKIAALPVTPKTSEAMGARWRQRANRALTQTTQMTGLARLSSPRGSRGAFQTQATACQKRTENSLENTHCRKARKRFISTSPRRLFTEEDVRLLYDTLPSLRFL